MIDISANFITSNCCGFVVKLVPQIHNKSNKINGVCAMEFITWALVTSEVSLAPNRQSISGLVEKYSVMYSLAAKLVATVYSS